MSEQAWLPIPGFADYLATRAGRIVSLKKWRGHPGPRELRASVGGNGYLMLGLKDADGVESRTYVHQLVALTFLGPRPVGQHVRHLDGNPLNNAASNLAYGTPSENHHDAVRHGTHNNASKTHCKQGHPFDEANTYRGAKQRACRTCSVERGRARRRRLGAKPRVFRAAA